MESFSGSNIKKFFTFSRRKAVLIFPLKNPPPPPQKKKKKKNSLYISENQNPQKIQEAELS